MAMHATQHAHCPRLGERRRLTTSGTAACVCYLLWDGGRRTYVGKTNDMRRRLRQHNGELVGGARSTRLRADSGRRWRLAALVRGFPSSAEALQFEWRLHHPPRRRRPGAPGLRRRLAALVDVLALERWTRRAPLAASVPLCLELGADVVAEDDVEALTSRLATLAHVECRVV